MKQVQRGKSIIDMDRNKKTIAHKLNPDIFV